MMSSRLLAKSGVLGILWKSPPGCSLKSDQPDVWDAVGESGVPLVVWLREPPPENQAVDLKALFQQKWDELAGVVQKVRLEAAGHKQWHVGRHLAVILDDPRRPLPTASRGGRLRSPASTR